jgi:hypothetical protein
MPFRHHPDPEEKLPDWLKPPEGEPAGAEGHDAHTDEPEEKLPDWLTGSGAEYEEAPGFSGDQEDAEVARQVPEPASTDEEAKEPTEPEWLENLQQSYGEESEETEVLPEEEEHPTDLSSEPGLEPMPDEEPQDWSDWTEEPGKEGEEPGTGESDIELDWAKNLPFAEEGEAEEELPIEDAGDFESAPKEEEPQAADAPSWLDEILGGASKRQEGETPNWLEDLQTEAESLPHASAFDTEGIQWASSGDEDQPEEDKAEQKEIPDEFGEDIFGDPDWLKMVRKDTASLPPLTHPPDSDTFISDLEDEEIGLDSIEIPDWLEDESQEAITSPTPIDKEVEEEEPEIKLAPAELPDWLEALRPSKAPKAEPGKAAAPEIKEEEKSQGPLAGLEDVLPPSIPMFSSEMSASQPAEGLHITPTLRTHVALLKEMASKEGQAILPVKRVIPLPQRIQRWVITAVVFLAAFAPLLLGSSLAAVPALTPAAAAAYQTIEGLPSGAPVLVAVEYQLAYSGEMQAVATALLEHMLTKGLQPVFISSQPTGPGLAERLVKDNLNQHAYISQNSYPSPAYLAGDTAALLNFAIDPRGSLPMPLSGGGSRWDQPPLNSIQTITDFAAVLVVADDPDTARAWIEQVQPSLTAGGRPMILAVSAQAAPLMEPYTQSNPPQVSGLVSGLSGAVSYDTSRGGQFVRQYWDAFTWGANIAVLLVLIGGLYNLGRFWLEKRG